MLPGSNKCSINIKTFSVSPDNCADGLGSQAKIEIGCPKEIYARAEPEEPAAAAGPDHLDTGATLAVAGNISRLLHYHCRAKPYPIVEIDDVIVGHAETA